jgi:hypothetical protein
MRMGRRSITDIQRAKLLESFRTDPEPGAGASFRRAAAAAGLDARTARRAWQVGWPGVKPISDTIELERVLSRAALRREVLTQRLDEAARLAQEDAAEERAREGQSVRVVITAARNGLAALHAEAIHEYQRKLAKMMQADDPDDCKARAARRAYREIVEIVAKLAEASERGQRMERVLLGEPTAILGGEVGVRPVTPVDASPEELAEEVAAAQRALDELRQIETATETSHAGTNGTLTS